MLDDPATFEPFDPDQFGGERELLFGAQTGRGAARRLLDRAGRDATDTRVAELLEALEREGPLDESAAVRLATRL